MNTRLIPHYPFNGNYLDLDGIRLHYLDEGSGPPVVMVHGNPSWSFYYRNLVLALRTNRRCIVPDHIGCGLSDKPGDDRYDYTLSRRIDDLDRLIDHLRIKEKISLVMHDWGGMIGMGWAIRNPDRIARIAVMNSAAFHLPKEKPFPLALRICRDTFIGTLMVRGFNAFAAGAAAVGCKRNPMPPDIRRLYTLPYDSWRNRIATLRFVQDIPLKPGDRGYDIVTAVSEGIGRFKDIPMMIAWGERDFVFDRYFLAEWRKRFPDAKIHSFADCGHYILEDAAEEVIPLLCSFLA